MIRGYAQSKDMKVKAIGFYKLMMGINVLRNKFIYPFVLKACSGIGDLSLGKSVHGSVVKFGFDGDVHVGNTLVRMYSCVEEGVVFARKVFDEITERNSVTWSAMIGGYACLGLSGDAIGLFREMQMEGVCPDEVTIVSVLSACSDLDALGVKLHDCLSTSSTFRPCCAKSKAAASSNNPKPKTKSVICLDYDRNGIDMD